MGEACNQKHVAAAAVAGVMSPKSDIDRPSNDSCNTDCQTLPSCTQFRQYSLAAIRLLLDEELTNVTDWLYCRKASVANVELLRSRKLLFLLVTAVVKVAASRWPRNRKGTND